MKQWQLLAIAGIIVLGVVFAPLAESAIPPTRAWLRILTDAGNVTANSYAANLTMTGDGIIITSFFANNTLRFTSGVSSLAMEDLTNVTDSGCAVGQARTVNASGWYVCSNVGTGDITGAANVGTGTGAVFRDEIAGTLNFKTIKEGANISITNNADDITITAAAGASGYTKINNLDGGTAKILATNITNQATVKTLTAGTGITITNGSKTITIATSGGSGFTELNSIDGGNARLLKSNSTNEGVFKSLTAGTNISITNGTDTLTISASASGGATVLAANVTNSGAPASDVQVWSISLTPNSGNTVKGVITASSSVAGNAARGAANVTSLQSRGFCQWTQVSTTTANAIDNLVLNTVLTGRAANTGETAWIAAVNTPMPILFDCSIQSGATPGNLRIFINKEVAGGSIQAKAGSFYIKTP